MRHDQVRLNTGLYVGPSLTEQLLNAVDCMNMRTLLMRQGQTEQAISQTLQDFMKQDQVRLNTLVFMRHDQVRLNTGLYAGPIFVILTRKFNKIMICTPLD
jgi:hypothetical protein